MGINKGHISEFSRFLSEELTTRLYRTHRFDVIERQLLHRTMQEHQLSMMSMVDERSAKELGRLIGADVIASGSITDLGSAVKINMRLIDTENGSVFSAASISIPKTDMVANLMAKRLKEEMPSFSQNNTTAGGEQQYKAGDMDPAYAPGGPAKQAETKPNASRTITVFEKVGFRLAVTGCGISVDGTVVCTLTVTNTMDQNREFTVQYGNPDTRMFDNKGNEYVITTIAMANASHRFHTMGSSYQEMRKTCVSGIPVQTVLMFEKVARDAKKIALLEINCGRNCSFAFRDMAL